jgi:predicted membrane-bound spermidine synthase
MFLQQPNTQQPVSQNKKATVGFVFSLVGAILILLRGLVRITVGDIITFAGSDEIRRRFFAGLALNILGGIAVVFAVLIIVGAYLIYIGMGTAGGTIVLVFSVLSIFVGSGWLIGLIFGVVGGILGLLKK